MRTINYGARLYTDLYSHVMSVKCKCTVDHLRFNGGLGSDDFDDTCNLDTSVIKSSYAVIGQDATV
jgi:hypothetical protein